MAGATKAPAALTDIIVTRSLGYSLGYVRTGVRACVVYLLWRGCFVLIWEPLFQHGLGPQASDRVRDPAQRFGLCRSGRAPGRVLRVLFTRVLVCWIGRCSSIL